MTFVIPNQLAEEAITKVRLMAHTRQIEVNHAYMDGLVNAQHYSAWLCPKASSLALEMILKVAAK